MYNLKKIKNKIDIASIIKKYVKLNGRNKKFFGICPFHKEKTPSFHVRSDKAYFKCFGCGESGDVFAFIKKYKKITFEDSLIYLNVKKNQENNNIFFPIKKNNEYYYVLKYVKKYFSKNLLSNGGKIALNYLKQSRGLENSDIENFKIGFADSFEKNLYSYLKKKI